LGGDVLIDIFHLERITTTILDRQHMGQSGRNSWTSTLGRRRSRSPPKSLAAQAIWMTVMTCLSVWLGSNAMLSMSAHWT
jgi:hypothetical protein